LVNIQRSLGSVSARTRQAEMVTRYGYWRGEDSEGCEKRRLGRRPGSPPHLFRQAAGRDAGKATNLKLVAGCNKPAELQSEKAVEVVRNHEDGTRPTAWRWRSEGVLAHWERTAAGIPAGRHTRRISREKSSCERAGADAPQLRKRGKDHEGCAGIHRISPRGSIGKTTQASPETGQGQGGNGEGQRPITD